MTNSVVKTNNFTKRIYKKNAKYAAAFFFSDGMTDIFREILVFGAWIKILLETIFHKRKHHINHNLFPPKELEFDIKIILDHARNKFWFLMEILFII